jgi:hypothetical protein
VNVLKVTVFAGVVSIALAACGGARSGGGMTGAASPRLAVEQFLAAARAQDLQAFSAIWGSEKGSSRDVVPRDQLEKRELIYMCYLSHEKFDVTNDATVKPTQHDVQVMLTRGPISRETKMTVVQGPSDRWYVQNVELQPLQDLCSQSPKR